MQETVSPAGDTVECPLCGEPIKAKAIKCKHCGSDLEAFNKRKAQKAKVQAVKTKASKKSRALLSHSQKLSAIPKKQLLVGAAGILILWFAGYMAYWEWLPALDRNIEQASMQTARLEYRSLEPAGLPGYEILAPKSSHNVELNNGQTKLLMHFYHLIDKNRYVYITLRAAPGYYDETSRLRQEGFESDVREVSWGEHHFDIITYSKPVYVDGQKMLMPEWHDEQYYVLGSRDNPIFLAVAKRSRGMTGQEDEAVQRVLGSIRRPSSSEVWPHRFR